MNREYSMKRLLLLISVGAWLTVLGGCDEFASEKEFYTVRVAEEKLREIGTLELEVRQEKGEPIVDIDATPASELELSLEQVRALTLGNNLDLKVQLIEPSIAAAQVSEEEAKFEWAFFSNLNYRDLRQPTYQTADQASTLESTAIDMGVQIPLRTGGMVTFNVADTKTSTTYPGASLPTFYDEQATISISHPLLRGAGKRANTHSIRIAQYQRQITDAQTKLEVIRVLANADRGYWRLYAARRELEVRKQEYELAETQLEQTRRMVDSGEKSQVEILRSEAGLAERLEGIIMAENALRDRERELKQILNQAGLRTDSPTALVPMTEPDPMRYDLDRHRIVAAAIENRMEMLELELQIGQAISSIDYYRSQTLPLVTLDYTYNLQGQGSTRDNAYHVLAERNFKSDILGLRLLVPLGNGAAKSRLRQAFYQRQRQLASRENRRTLIEMEVLSAIDRLEANWQSILASRQNSLLAGRLYEAERRQYELGLRTSTDVLDQQAKFANAQSAEIKALTEYQIAQIDLAYATGTLFGAAKVRWEPIVPKTRLSRSD